MKKNCYKGKMILAKKQVVFYLFLVYFVGKLQHIVISMVEKRIITSNEYLIVIIEGAIRVLSELIVDFEQDGLENEHLKQELKHLEQNIFELKGTY